MISIEVIHKVWVTLLYVSSGANLQLLIDLMKSEMKNVTKHVIVGDFNFDKEDSNDMTRFLESEGYHQLVTKPTHEAGRTIDLCYEYPFGGVDQINVNYPYYSDHASLCITLANKQD